MTDERFSRTEILLGEAKMARLQESRVAIFGIGGVGGYVAEALARSGVGTFTLVDHDTVSLSNLNRQIIATEETVGKQKTEVMAERIRSVNPGACVFVRNEFFLPENADTFRFQEFDYVVDAVDTVTAKIALIECAKRAGVPVISAMGAGNKLDPTGFKVADISKTKVCPLAKTMRRELAKRNIGHVKVVYSEEPPAEPASAGALLSAQMENPGRRSVPGSIAYAPAIMGLIIASEVIRDLTRETEERIDYEPVCTETE